MIDFHMQVNIFIAQKVFAHISTNIRYEKHLKRKMLPSTKGNTFLCNSYALITSIRIEPNNRM